MLPVFPVQRQLHHARYYSTPAHVAQAACATPLTRWAFKSGMCLDERPGFACGSMVRFFLFHKTFAQSANVL